MNGKSFTNILTSGYIRGECNKAIISYSGSNLDCQFVSDDKVLAGNVVSENFNEGVDFLEGKVAGIPDVDSLIKMIKTLGKEVTISLDTVSSNESYLLLKDGVINMRYGLITDSQMPKRVRLKLDQLQSTPAVIFIDKTFIEQFYKLSGAVKDCKVLYVRCYDNVLELLISQTADFNTGVKLTPPIDGDASDFKMLKFDMKKFRNLLKNNKAADATRLTFYGEGVCKIDIASSDYSGSYNIIANQ